MPQPHQVTLTRAFAIGILANSLFVLLEAVAGAWYHSLALLADAGHNAGDVGGLLLAWMALKLAEKKSNASFTFGYKKTTILVALVQSLVLLAILANIGYQAILRLFSPQPLTGGAMTAVALIGIVINGGTALLFKRLGPRNLNISAAFLHLAADAAVSAAVACAGIAIIFTHWYWLDGAVSVAIILIVLRETWALLKESLRLALDAVPKEIDGATVKAGIMAIPGIAAIHHMHIWPISTSETALTAHLVLDNNPNATTVENLKRQVRDYLFGLGISHATLETESDEHACTHATC